MKKLLLAAAIVVTAISANAQSNAGKIYVGANLVDVGYTSAFTFAITAPHMPFISFSNGSGPLDPAAPTARDRKSDSKFGISLNGGYFLNDSWAIGLGLGFSSGTNVDSTGVTGTPTYNEFTDKTTEFTVMPYVRYMKVMTGKWSMLADAGLSISSKVADGTQSLANSGSTKTTTTGFGIMIRPGFAYAMTERLNIIGTLSANFLSFNSSSIETVTTPAGAGATAVTTKGSNSGLGLNLNPFAGTAVTFGINYTFGGAK